jgi:signal transduction histidine kinase
VVCKSLDDGDIIIRVTDTGIGIAEDDIERILIPFVQVGDRSDVEGTGLGLSITKALVELHEGRLDIASRLGEGTTVTITLPKRRVVAAPASAGAEQRAR